MLNKDSSLQPLMGTQATRYSIPLLPVLTRNTTSKKTSDEGLVKGGFVVENPPYKIDTLLFIGSPQSLLSYLKNKLRVTLDTETIDFESTSGLTIPMNRRDGSNFILIWMPRFDFTLSTMAPLVHEVIHATIYILKMSGTKSKIFDTADDEDADDEGIANGADSMFENLMDKVERKWLAEERSRQAKIKSSKKRAKRK